MALTMQLKALFDKCSVPDAIREFLVSKQCVTIHDFANIVDDKKDIAQVIVAKTSSSSDLSVIARTKQAWREAEAITQKSLKRSAEGISTEEQDEPLQPEVHDNVITLAADYYRVESFDARMLGCDALVGRIRREFEKSLPTMFPLARVRSLAISQKPVSAKKTRIGEGAFLETGEIPESDIGSTRKWLRSLEVLTTTWFVAGCYDVQWEGRTIKFCTQDVAVKYFREFSFLTDELLVEFFDSSVVDYCASVDEALRIRCLEYVRAKEENPTKGKMPWGPSVTKVLSESSRTWNDKRSLLRTLPSAQSASKQPPPPAAGQADAQRPQQPRSSGQPQKAPSTSAGPQRKNWTTAKVGTKGIEVCKKYNDRRGCKASKCKYSHECDVVLARGGSNCGSSSHNREGHDPDRHGAPSTKA